MSTRRLSLSCSFPFASKLTGSRATASSASSATHLDYYRLLTMRDVDIERQDLIRLSYRFYPREKSDRGRTRARPSLRAHSLSLSLRGFHPREFLGSHQRDSIAISMTGLTPESNCGRPFHEPIRLDVEKRIKAPVFIVYRQTVKSHKLYPRKPAASWRESFPDRRNGRARE